MKISTLFILFTIFTLGLNQCKNDCLNPNRCELIPETGPCKALIVKYYFDKSEKKCKEFNWGGCDGVVPFETKEDCQAQCKCK